MCFACFQGTIEVLKSAERGNTRNSVQTFPKSIEPYSSTIIVVFTYEPVYVVTAVNMYLISSVALIVVFIEV